ncbi:DUF4336 domain-containing protein [Isoptericola cucumis]|uniref:DUF4336 domain-containing protein n=1 Tax=Isoptericola cucumis TaxID=1776856 RepID=UPI0032079CB7
MSGWSELGDGLVVVDGPVVRDTGMPFTTRMTVVTLSDGSLWVESPVPASYETLTRLTAIGPVRHLVSNTPRHVWRLDAWHELFPDAELWSVRHTPATLRRSTLPLSGVLGAEPPAAWAADLDQAPLLGSRLLEEVCFFHRRSRTLVLGDVVQVHQQLPGRAFSNAVKRWGGVAAPDGGTSVDIRLSFRDRGALRASVRRVLDWDFSQVVLAHGPVVTHDARAFVERAFAWALD